MHEARTGMIEQLADAGFAPAAAAVAAGLIPGATLGVVTCDGARAVRVAGHAALEPAREPLTQAHWFDLASVSKVIFTTPVILKLADEGGLDLDAPIADVIPDLRQYDVAGALERSLTARQLLSHATHLPAVEPIYTYGDDPARLRALVLQRAWRHGAPVYSDINFILLGIAIERITGAALDAWPLPEGLRFTPEGPAVATERCAWRNRVLKGEVHDENAFALHRAGHAGLFGTVAGVLDFARGLLDGTGASPAAIGAMRERVNGDRTAGWERRFAGWPGGDACADATIGHTGFTGTGLWIDFDRGIAWTLLTNRVHPTRHGADAIFAVRPAVGNALVAAFDAVARMRSVSRSAPSG